MGVQTNIWIIWLIFALLFASLAGYHFRLSKKSLPQFRPTGISYRGPPPRGIPVNIGVTARDIILTFNSYRDAFNSYIKESNKSSCRQNIAQAV